MKKLYVIKIGLYCVLNYLFIMTMVLGILKKNLLIVMVEKRFIHEIFHLMDHINYIQIQNIKEHIIM